MAQQRKRCPSIFWLLAVVTWFTFSQAQDPVDLSECGSTKSCFVIPSGCSSDCERVFTWKENGDSYDIEMSFITEGWGAVGFSESGGMDETKVIACVGANGEPMNSHNEGYSNIPLTGQEQVGISDIESGYVDGEVRCRFTRVKTVTGVSNSDDFADLTRDDYYLILATGPVSGSDMMLPHTDYPPVSEETVDLAKTQDIGGSAVKSFDMVKAHACLMICAWVILAAIGISFARYYKEAWPESEPCGIKIWFVFHRPLMVLVFCCTVAGFIIIFVYKESWSYLPAEPTILKIHPYFGTVVTAFAIINPIMALFRPHPGTPNRYIFNWFHWGVGSLAFVLAIFTIFLGIRLTTSPAPDWLTWVMVGFVAFHFLTWVIFEIHGCATRRRNVSDNMEMTAHGGKAVSGSDRSGDSFKTFMIILYALVAIGCGACMVVVIALDVE